MVRSRACDEVVSQYTRWMSNQFEVEKVGSACVITTPYARPDGDLIDLTVRMRPDGAMIVGDGASTMDYLVLSGVNPESEARGAVTKALLDTSGVGLDNDELFLVVPPGQDLGLAVHTLIEVVQQVQSLVFTRKELPYQPFKEQVRQFLSEHRIDYRPEDFLEGKVARQRFDFVVRSGGIKAIRALSAQRPSTAKVLALQTMWSFMDVRNAGVNFTGISVLDDTSPNRVWTGEPLSILSESSARIVSWANKERLLEILVA